MKFPWRKWFPKDWLTERAAAKASLEARGLWREALDVMMDNDTYLLEADSQQSLAHDLRCTVAEIHRSLPQVKASGLGDVTFNSNGSVTLVSRRLKREAQARKSAALRVARFREKHKRNDPCNGDVTSAYASASVSSPKGNGGPGERDAELPRGFPATSDDALAQCQIIGADAVFVTQLWNGAMARSGKDALGQPIRSFPHYVAKHWPKEQAKRFEEKKQKQGTYEAEAKARAERSRRLLG